MQPGLILLSAALAMGQPGGVESTARPDVVVENAFVKLVQGGEAHVAAQESGLLMELPVREGDTLRPGDLIARTDDRQAVAQKKVAEAEQRVAETEASSDINELYAEAAHKVAMKEYELNQLANEKVPGSKPAVLLQHLALKAEEARLQREQAKLKKQVARYTAEARGAEVEAAQIMIDRRRIESPLEGMVVKVLRNVGEWVNPGDEIAHVVRLDRLRVEGYISLADATPSEVIGRPISAKVGFARGVEREFQGRLVFANPRIEQGGRYLVVAEVENRQEGGEWVMMPGQQALMTIHLGEPAPRAAVELRRPRAQ